MPGTLWWQNRSQRLLRINVVIIKLPPEQSDIGLAIFVVNTGDTDDHRNGISIGDAGAFLCRAAQRDTPEITAFDHEGDADPPLRDVGTRHVAR